MTFHRRMRRLPLDQIRLTDRFWTRWQRVLRERTIEAQYEQIVQTGRLQNFLNAAKGTPRTAPAAPALCDQTSTNAPLASRPEDGGYVGYYFNDSDVYKWLEAAAYALIPGPDPKIQMRIDEAVAAIEAAQEPDGYLNTFFQIKHPHLKWRNLVSMHEMYCAGHLIEAAVAMRECSPNKDRRLLDVAIRLADHIMAIFGPGERRGYCGHQEIELALLRLSDATGEAKYRDFARWMIEERGRRPTVFEQELDDAEAMTLSPWASRMMTKDGDYSGEYAQDHAPIREHEEVVGHAVRAMYFYIAAAQLAEGDADLSQALECTWRNLTGKRMYVTGGIGPSGSNEGFTFDFDLPNLTAYAETCAACGLVFWGQQMVEMTGLSEYADTVERALYNGAISGISLSGDRFSYTNPLESRGLEERVPWFDCACCPPNIARLIGSVGAYVASVSETAFWIHIPAGFEARTDFGGTGVKIACESDYPWSGKLKIQVDPDTPVTFELRFRIPDWAEDVETNLPGLERPAEWDGGYAVFAKRWEKGDVLEVDLGMEPRWIESHPKVRANLGRIALMRGPLVYCAEEYDLGFAPQLFTADPEAPVSVLDSDILGGGCTMTVDGYAEEERFADDLYAPAGTLETHVATASLIPYYAWGNRGRNSMQVWLRRA